MSTAQGHLRASQELNITQVNSLTQVIAAAVWAYTAITVSLFDIALVYNSI